MSLHASSRRRLPVAAALLGCAVLAAPASAAVVGADKSIVVESNSSGVTLSGFPNLAPVSVIRDGVTIASAKNVNIPGPAPAEGGVNSAHIGAGGGCWTAFTPQLLPGDTVKVGTDTTIIRDVTAEPLITKDGQIIIHGTATSATGRPLPSDEIDAQIHSPGGRFSAGSSGGQFLSAQRGNLGGVVTYDATGSNHWTARWPALGLADNNLALAGTVIAAWTGPAGAPPTAGGEETDFEVGATPGSIDACADVPFAPNAPSKASRSLNIAGAGTDLVVSGSAQPGVTGVNVTLTDAAGNARNAAATLAGTSWTATFPAGDVAGLGDGAIRVSGAFTTTGATAPLTNGTFHGATMTVAKDTVAPAAPTASVPAGAYRAAQSVALAAESGATIRYTTDGTDPTPSSAQYNGLLAVPASQTIKAIAIDAAGNQSGVAAFAYGIGAAALERSAAANLRVRALKVSQRLRLRTAHRHGIRLSFRVPAGAKIVRARLMLRGRIVSQVVRNVRAGRRITIILPRTGKGRAKLRRGKYLVVVTPGVSSRAFGIPTSRTVRIK